MNIAVTKNSMYLLAMVTFLIAAIIINDATTSKIFTSLGILTGMFIIKNLSNQNVKKNE